MGVNNLATFKLSVCYFYTYQTTYTDHLIVNIVFSLIPYDQITFSSGPKKISYFYIYVT